MWRTPGVYPGTSLFVIFINDMVKMVENTAITLYTDNTAFLIGGKEVSNICRKMNNAAAEFAHWCSINRLTLNLNKAKLMLFSNKF